MSSVQYQPGVLLYMPISHVILLQRITQTLPVPRRNKPPVVGKCSVSVRCLFFVRVVSVVGLLKLSKIPMMIHSARQKVRKQGDPTCTELGG